MRIVLQAESGARAGHRIWLGANQRVFVGGTEWADFSVPGDPEIADVQFVVESDQHHCRVRNLQSMPSILVNGVEVFERTLVDGDIVTAGGTRFSVVVQESSAIAAKQAAIRTRRSRALVPVSLRTCPSSLVLCEDFGREKTAPGIAQALARESSLYLLLHVTRSGVALPIELRTVTDLFARGELDVAECLQYSPIVLSEKDPIDRFQLLSQAWGKDGIIAVFTRLDRDTLLRNLQRSTVWLCPPSVVRGHLTNGPADSVRDVMDGISAVLMEADDREGFVLLGPPEAAAEWSHVENGGPSESGISTPASSEASPAAPVSSVPSKTASKRRRHRSSNKRA